MSDNANTTVLGKILDFLVALFTALKEADHKLHGLPFVVFACRFLHFVFLIFIFSLSIFCFCFVLFCFTQMWMLAF
jgi:hypothetical protein